MEENDVEGYIGNSTGPLKVPILVHVASARACLPPFLSLPGPQSYSLEKAAELRVLYLQVQQLAQPQAASVGRLQQHPVPPRRRRLEQPHHFGGAEHARQAVSPLAEH